MATGPAHGILGDGNFGTDLPETQVPEDALTAEQAIAKYSKSKEFKALQAHLQSRIDFYKQQLPGGIAVEDATALTDAQLGAQWRASAVVIAEFEAIIATYTTAGKLMKK